VETQEQACEKYKSQLHSLCLAQDIHAEGTFITLLVFIEKLGLFQSVGNPGPAFFEAIRVKVTQAV
jgi:hypothetical protein